MNGKNVPMIFVLVFLFAAFVLGCGEKAEDDKGKGVSEEEFRIPDSLLSPLDSYKLTRDEYHPIKGGVMGNE
ncbi:MAG: hypothetical protein KAX38_05600, partial [Candidatus Krumholzibacteria bacterium]|nr:hypothetical protein [Candidatus Krumholzibacteria bacterium]